MSADASALSLAPAEVLVERRDDGSLVLRSPQPLGAHARVAGDWLRHWARAAPQRCFLAERAGDDWRRVDYAQAELAARRIGAALLARGLGPLRPVVVLSDNSIDHALLALGAMHVGVPIVPVSPAYSLMSADHAKLRHIVSLVRPGLVHASDPVRFGAALAAIGMNSTSVAELLEQGADPALATSADAASAATGPDSVAKILFTSGSTGMPKGVINTQRMITANQQQSAQVWRFLTESPPVIVDWLPWNHTFGGNYDFFLVLSNGGTLYIDGGKPAPGLIETSVRNLKDVAPTMYFNVPRGFDLLMPYLERDEALRRNFFSRCEFVFYAGAALPQNLWDRFAKLALETRGRPILLVSAWGATETAPLNTAVHYPVDRAGVIGLPTPGLELKLVPSAGKLEARVRGPNVTPGYFGSEALTRAAFDDEGFYRMGDALRFVDPQVPERGLAFDGRVAEDFKLRSGTWVHVGALRVRLIAAADPYVQDAVITGHDGDEAGALLFMNPAACAGESPQALRAHVAAALRRLAQESGGSSSMRVARALMLADAPRFDAGEITDKGYLNQRAVLDARASDVRRLHMAPDDPQVIVAG